MGRCLLFGDTMMSTAEQNIAAIDLVWRMANLDPVNDDIDHEQVLNDLTLEAYNIRYGSN